MMLMSFSRNVIHFRPHITPRRHHWWTFHCFSWCMINSSCMLHEIGDNFWIKRSSFHYIMSRKCLIKMREKPELTKRYFSLCPRAMYFISFFIIKFSPFHTLWHKWAFHKDQYHFFFRNIFQLLEVRNLLIREVNMFFMSSCFDVYVMIRFWKKNQKLLRFFEVSQTVFSVFMTLKNIFSTHFQDLGKYVDEQEEKLICFVPGAKRVWTTRKFLKLTLMSSLETTTFTIYGKIKL